MIVDIHHRDITDPWNKRDIVIGMNTQLAEASAIGRRVLIGKSLSRDLELGNVITFKFDEHRELHMVVCHSLGAGGWDGAHQHVRCGLDYLWQRSRGGSREYSIVRIGTGPVGRRDGADFVAIHTAMADSFLPLHLFICDEEKQANANVVNLPPLQPRCVWRYSEGERELRVAA